MKGQDFSESDHSNYYV